MQFTKWSRGIHSISSGLDSNIYTSIEARLLQIFREFWDCSSVLVLIVIAHTKETISWGERGTLRKFWFVFFLGSGFPCVALSYLYEILRLPYCFASVSRLQKKLKRIVCVPLSSICFKPICKISFCIPCHWMKVDGYSATIEAIQSSHSSLNSLSFCFSRALSKVSDYCIAWPDFIIFLST